jgi:RHS repeat-associated protein
MVAINTKCSFLDRSDAVLVSTSFTDAYCLLPNDSFNYLTDGNKNVIVLLDDNGKFQAKYTYDPYGKLLNSQGPSADENPFRFSSEYFDDESGLVYYIHRYYSPELGRWLSRDPIGEKGGWNLYIVVNNNIIDKSDRFGLRAADPSCTSISPHWTEWDGTEVNEGDPYWELSSLNTAFSVVTLFFGGPAIQTTGTVVGSFEVYQLKQKVKLGMRRCWYEVCCSMKRYNSGQCFIYFQKRCIGDTPKYKEKIIDIRSSPPSPDNPLQPLDDRTRFAGTTSSRLIS